MKNFLLKPIILLLFMFVIMQTNAQIKTITIEKAGKLKSLLKKEESTKTLCIKGMMNHKDFEALSLLQNIVSLDLSDIEIENAMSVRELVLPKLPNLKKIYIPNSSEALVRLMMYNKEGYSVDTVVISNENEILVQVNLQGPLNGDESIKRLLSCMDNFYWNIFIPKVLICKGVKFICKSRVDHSYDGIEGFPNATSTRHRLEIQNLSDSLLLKDGIVVGDYFRGSNITKLAFSDKIRYIGSSAFGECSNLQEVTFPEGCGDVYISSDAFKDCNALQRVKVPKGRIEEFAKKMNLPKIKFDDGTITLLEYNVKVEKPGTLLNYIPVDKLEWVGSLTITGILNEKDLNALKGCVRLKTIDLSRTYTTLSEELQRQRNADREFELALFRTMGALGDKQYKNGEIGSVEHLQISLFSELVNEAAKVKTSDDGCVIAAGSFSGLENLETVILPLRASKIEDNAFVGCRKLTKVILPPYLVKIGDGAFSGCTSLKDIQFPTTLTSIGSSSGHRCFVNTAIEEFDLSKCVFKNNSMIYKDWTYEFQGCNATRVVKLPQGVASVDIGVRAYDKYGNAVSKNDVIYYVPASVKNIKFRSRAKEIHFASPEPPYISYGLSGCTIYLPKGCMTSYYSAFGSGNNVLKEE